ncbi:MAG: Mor transcription activator family protein [Candidatus Competibacter denitrificans]
MTDPHLLPPDTYPGILTDLIALVGARARAYLPPDAADALACELTEDVRLKFGGALIYVPKGCANDRTDRNAAIWRDFNGRNHAQLARKYGLTLRRIYNILAAERATRQTCLFN